MQILALATVHNRKEKTLRSLAALRAQVLPAGVSVQVVIVDDGSQDGTHKLVSEHYPEVILLKGTGSLYWAGGMRYGWKEYISKQYFDALLVFNDDIDLKENALSCLIKVLRDQTDPNLSLVTGAFLDPENGTCSYGGLVRRSRWHPLRFRKVSPSAAVQQVCTLNMNFALIPKSVLQQIGFIASYFTHSMGDLEFGLRLSKNGGKVLLAPDYVGWCSKNSKVGTSAEPGLSGQVRMRRLISVKEQPIAARAKYYRAHAGIFWPVFWSLTYIRAIFARKK